MNKDFYTKIPVWIQNKLDMKVLLYRNEEWFKNAWDEYREHCLTADAKDIIDPDYFFIKKEKEFDEMKSSDDDGVSFLEDFSDGARL